MDNNVYRDGRVHVQAGKCATCIYRPGNLMRLADGRVEAMEREALEGDNAICRGFFDVTKQGTLLEVAERIGIIEWVPLCTDDN